MPLNNLILRNIKGSELTHAEMDSNLAQFFYSASRDGNNITLFSTGSGSIPAQQVTLLSASANTVDSIAAHSDSFTASLAITASHNFNTKDIVVQVYDANDNLIIPDTINTTNLNETYVTFAGTTTGRVVVGKAGHVIPYFDSASFVNTASLNNTASTFAVTSSNQFTQSQFFTGSLIPYASGGNGVYDLGSVTNPWQDLYITTASLKFVKDAVVQSTLNGEADGIRIGNIFIGTSSIAIVSGSGANLTTVGTIASSSVGAGGAVTASGGSVTSVPNGTISSSGQITAFGFLTESTLSGSVDAVSLTSSLVEFGFLTSSNTTSSTAFSGSMTIGAGLLDDDEGLVVTGTSTFSGSITSTGTITTNTGMIVNGSSVFTGSNLFTGENVFSGENMKFTGSVNVTGSFDISGSQKITGSLNVSQSITAGTGFTGSLLGTASYSTFAETSTTASYITSSGVDGPYGMDSIVSASHAVTASYADNVPDTSSFAITASYAVTASHALNVPDTSSYALNADKVDGIQLADIALLTSSNSFSSSQIISGALDLAPAADPGSSNTNATFLFTSRSNQDVNSCDFYYRNKGTLWDQEWIQELVDTGIQYGGVVSFSGSSILVTPGAGLIVDYNAATSSNSNTVPTQISWNAITASATYVTSSQYSYLLINESGQLQQQTTEFTPQQFAEKLPLGIITHINQTTIDSVGEIRQTTYGKFSQASEFVRAFGPLKVQGFGIDGNDGALGFEVGSGTAFKLGGFYKQQPATPSSYVVPAVTSSNAIVRAYKSATPGVFTADNNGGSLFSEIDFTKYDNGSGTLETVSGSSVTIQRAYLGPVSERIYVYYGQNKYESLTTAVSNITTEAFEESKTTIENLVFIGYIIGQANATSLADTASVNIINSGLFRNTAGSSGGGSATVSVINDITDVSISSPSTGEALIYNAGTWENADYNYTRLTNKPAGIVSGSTQIDALGFLQVAGDNVISSSTQVISALPSGVISGSSQIEALGYPAASGGGLISSSAQILDGSDIISSSQYSSISQGTITFNDNGNSELVSVGTRASDSVTFSGLTVSGSAVVTGSLQVSGSVVGHLGTIQTVGSERRLKATTGDFFELSLVNSTAYTITVTGAKPGQTINLKTIQSSGGTGTVTFGSEFKFGDGVSEAASTGANEVDLFSMITFDGTNFYVSPVKNMS